MRPAPDAAVAPRARSIPLILIGLVAGFLSGLFGVGGGVLIVPALVLALGFVQRRANGTSLAAVVPISIVGAVAYLAAGHIDLRIAGILLVGTLTGAYLGVRLLHALNDQPLRWAFIILLVAVAVRLMFDVPSREDTLDFTVWIVVGLLALGLVTGTLSGLLGVGGGVILVPVLIALFEVSDLVAKGVSLLVVIPTGIVSTLLSLRRGSVDLRAAAMVGSAGALTAVAGAAIAWLLPPQTAAILFAVFLVLVAARLAVAAIRTRAAAKGTGR